MTDTERSTEASGLYPEQFPSSVDWPRWRVVRERTRREHADGDVLALLAFDPADAKVVV